MVLPGEIILHSWSLESTRSAQKCKECISDSVVTSREAETVVIVDVPEVSHVPEECVSDSVVASPEVPTAVIVDVPEVPEVPEGLHGIGKVEALPGVLSALQGAMAALSSEIIAYNSQRERKPHTR